MKKTVKTKTTLDKIRAILAKDQCAIDHLDGIVDEQATQMAIAINNDGLKAQLEFLNQRGISDEETLADLEESIVSIS